jgi:hypothetical protein
LVILHAFLALLAGFATMVLGVMGFTMLLARLTPSWAGLTGPPKRGYISSVHPLEHVLMLGIVVLLLSGISAMVSKSQQPTLYQIALVAIMPLGVLAGGILRLRVLGIL